MGHNDLGSVPVHIRSAGRSLQVAGVPAHGEYLTPLEPRQNRRSAIRTLDNPTLALESPQPRMPTPAPQRDSGSNQPQFAVGARSIARSEQSRAFRKISPRADIPGLTRGVLFVFLCVSVDCPGVPTGKQTPTSIGIAQLLKTRSFNLPPIGEAHRPAERGLRCSSRRYVTARLMLLMASSISCVLLNPIVAQSTPAFWKANLTAFTRSS